MTPTIIAIILSVLTLLFGSGILTVLLRHSNKNAVMESVVTRLEGQVKQLEKTQGTFTTDLALTNQTVIDIKARLNKLDLIETMNEKMNYFLKIAEQIMPRPEAEAKFLAVNEKVTHLEELVENKSS